MPDTLRLQLLMGPTIATPVPAELSDALLSAQVTVSSGQASGFQLTFAVSKRSVITQRLLPTGAFDPKVRVILVAVDPAQTQVLVDGVVTRQELSPGDDPGTGTLSITGEDLTVLMDLSERREAYPGMASQDRVSAICARYADYGIQATVVPEIVTDVPNPVQHIPIQTGTDLAYLKTLAEQAGYVFYLVPGPQPGASTAYWGPEVRVGLPQPALSIDFDGDTNVESLSFGFDGRSRTQWTVTRTDPDTKASVEIPIPDISLLHPPLAARPAVTLRQAPLPDTDRIDPVRLALLGASATSDVADAITGSGTLDVVRYGHILRPRELVSVRGAGLAYDGFYYVTSVTHNLNRGSYKQNFSLSRDGLVSLTRTVPT